MTISDGILPLRTQSGEQHIDIIEVAVLNLSLRGLVIPNLKYRLQSHYNFDPT